MSRDCTASQHMAAQGGMGEDKASVLSAVFTRLVSEMVFVVLAAKYPNVHTILLTCALICIWCLHRAPQTQQEHPTGVFGFDFAGI